ncbi:MAG: hypothetical protein R2752_00885 [Vicinamibacterales bacterium]
MPAPGPSRAALPWRCDSTSRDRLGVAGIPRQIHVSCRARPDRAEWCSAPGTALLETATGNRPHPAGPTPARFRPLTPAKGHTISAKLFVGNLNFSTTQAEIETLFTAVGDVAEVFLPVDRSTGQPRGFAFVTFSDPSVVPEAISRFDGYELQGRMLKVNEARDREPRAADGFRSFDNNAQFKRPKPKGSRRGLRGRKRGF